MKSLAAHCSNRLSRLAVLLLCALAIIFAQTLSAMDSSAHAMDLSGASVSEDRACIDAPASEPDDGGATFTHTTHCSVHCFHAQSILCHTEILADRVVPPSRLIPSDPLVIDSAFLSRLKQPPKA